MKRIDLAAGQQLQESDLTRQGVLPPGALEAAADIIAQVRAGGDAAVRELTLRFDGACPDAFRVPDEVVRGALDLVDPQFVAAITKAADQIRSFHEHERGQSWTTYRPDGTVLGVKVTPVASAGIYVPGGRAQYPSTVLMDCIPAKVAGVRRIVMVTPPQKDGTLSAYTLAAAALAGVDEVYAVGGAQAIAALAYGTESIPRVAKVVGPGNAYVAAAKKLVSGDVGIDMVAGPSEVCVLADAQANPAVVAADLMAQAEHDPQATCYLVTPAAELVEPVLAALDAFCAQSPREQITRASLDDNGVVVVADNMDDALAAVNVIAPEHLELHTSDAWDLLGKVENAGAIFVGPWSSEPLGDYVAGPDHTLPTGGTALFSNPLGVYDFEKRSSVIGYTREGMLADADATQVMAQAEGLWAHALSVGVRRRVAQDGIDDPARLTVDATATAWPHELAAPGRVTL